MRILQVLFGGLGGHAAVAASIVRGDESRRHEHLMVFYGVEELSAENAATFHALRVNVVQSITKRKGSHVGPWLRVVEALREARADVVLLHSVSLIAPAVAWGRSARVPVIAVEHTSNQWKSRSDWVISALCARLANGVVYLTDQYRREVASALGPLARRDAHVIGNGVDATSFAPAISPRAPSPTRVGMLGRFVEARDHSTLIRAVAKLRRQGLDVVLVLAGDGATRPEAEAVAREEGLDRSACQFLGLVSQAKLPELLQSLDIYVQSSRAETMSTAVMQAMASALAVIGSDVPGIKSMIVPEETGLLVPVSDPDALASTIKRCIDDVDLRRRLGMRARAFAAEHWGEARMFRAYAEVASNLRVAARSRAH